MVCQLPVLPCKTGGCTVVYKVGRCNVSAMFAAIAIAQAQEHEKHVLYWLHVSWSRQGIVCVFSGMWQGACIMTP